MGITKAADLRAMPDGIYARIAGCVIARQRPGTASGFIFLSLEDETGISNAIIHPDLYERNRVVVTPARFCWSKARFRIRTAWFREGFGCCDLALSEVDVRSHDFH